MLLKKQLSERECDEKQYFKQLLGVDTPNATNEFPRRQ